VIKGESGEELRHGCAKVAGKPQNYKGSVGDS